MKKKISLILAAAMMLLTLSAVSCGKGNVLPVSSAAAVETEAPVVTEEPAETQVPVETKEPAETEAPVPLMWRVTDENGHTLYLFGTIHIGDKRNDAVLKRVGPVLDGCDALAVEFDVVAYEEDTAQMMQDLQQYVLTDGSIITDYMPEGLYKRACKLMKAAGLTPLAYTSYNLAMWAQLVDSAMATVCTKLKTEKAMDSLLIRHAYGREMPVLDVESSAFQMNMLNSFDNELYLMQIEETLDSVGTYNDDLTALYEAWLSGDREDLWTLMADEDKIEDGDGRTYTDEQIAMIVDYNRKLLDDRNKGMRDKAIEYLKSGQTVFFAVGAAHMANDAGLVRLLTDAGYTVEPFAY